MSKIGKEENISPRPLNITNNDRQITQRIHFPNHFVRKIMNSTLFSSLSLPLRHAIVESNMTSAYHL